MLESLASAYVWPPSWMRQQLWLALSTVAALPACQYSCYPAAWRSLLKEGACYTAAVMHRNPYTAQSSLPCQTLIASARLFQLDTAKQIQL